MGKPNIMGLPLLKSENVDWTWSNLEKTSFYNLFAQCLFFDLYIIANDEIKKLDFFM